ncbi:PKD domain-containing protein [Fulvivirga sediminis]|uniref:PKD domain-containing protein n=1 Tax=Fulvivirga sediminis TaxID=2803949 RepID=A0A937JYT7_9BACT|nr:PKD domain-containing protein [Fulvivirga sediminis]MBL3656753.1 PKD domain-containing protein [Fulvivirga sediminis]
MGANSFKNNHIDQSVILFFIFTILASSSVFAYRYFTNKPCVPVEFEVEANNFRVGEIIRFVDKTTEKGSREWHFGDSSKVESGSSTFHIYDRPGEYEVSLVLDGRCEGFANITILEKAFILDSTLLATFSIPESIRVGETLKIKDETKAAKSWEWRFGETAEVNSTEQNPSYVYQEPGLKTISLVVNGDVRYATKKKINVLPVIKEHKLKKTVVKKKAEAPPSIKYKPKELKEEPKEEFRAPDISTRDFGAKLLEVADEKASAKDFSEYICDNLQMPMSAKGKKTTFVEFCEKIKGKKLKIKELELFRNKKNNCVEYITIRYSTKLF